MSRSYMNANMTIEILERIELVMTEVDITVAEAEEVNSVEVSREVENSEVINTEDVEVIAVITTTGDSKIITTSVVEIMTIINLKIPILKIHTTFLEEAAEAVIEAMMVATTPEEEEAMVEVVEVMDIIRITKTTIIKRERLSLKELFLGKKLLITEVDIVEVVVKDKLEVTINTSLALTLSSGIKKEVNSAGSIIAKKEVRGMADREIIIKVKAMVSIMQVVLPGQRDNITIRKVTIMARDHITRNPTTTTTRTRTVITRWSRRNNLTRS